MRAIEAVTTPGETAALCQSVGVECERNLVGN